MAKREVQKIIIERGRGTGAQNIGKAKASAQRHATKGKRLVSNPRKKTLGHEFTEVAERHFEKGSLKSHRAAPGVTVVTGVRRKAKKPKFKRAKEV